MSDENQARLVKVSRYGLMPNDAANLSKFAGDQFVDAVKKIEGSLRKDCEYVHAVSCGASEFYGPNRNGDGWKADVLDRDMHTYLKHAKLFRDHINKKDSPYYGRVKVAFFDRERGYGRTLAEYNATKTAADELGGLVAERELEKLAKNGFIAVSHGCYTDPNFPILTRDRGYVGIADLTTDDYVWTHKARWRRVTGVTRRQFTGKVVNFRLHGMSPVDMEVTDNHPLWVKKLKKYATTVTKVDGSVSMRHGRNRKQIDQTATEWLCASHLEEGDLLFHYPVDYADTDAGRYELLSDDLAYVAGTYMAEGSIGYVKNIPNTVRFSCNIHDDFPKRIQPLIDKNWPGCRAGFSPHHSSNLGVEIHLFSSSLASFLKNMCGSGAKTKTISSTIFASSESVKLAFLAGWIDGDGCVDKKGCRIVSANRNLMLQGRDLLATMGIHSAIWLNSDGIGKNSVVSKSTKSYALAITWKHLKKLRGFSGKVSNSPFNHLADKEIKGIKSTTVRVMGDGSFAYRVKSVSERYVENITVYNCHVDEDQSYSAAGVASHNSDVGQDFCAHCGNVAKKRAEYCLSKEEGGTCTLFGCRNGMRKVAEDGRVQYTDNPKNIFYDLSDVESPADRIAYGVPMPGLHKSASIVVDYIELPPRYDLAAVDMQSSFGNRLMKAAVRLAELENQISVNDVDMNKMASLTAIAGDPSATISIAGLVDRDPYVKRGTAYTLATRKECPSAGQMAKAAGFDQKDAVLCDEISRGVLDNLFRQGKIASLLENSDFLSRPLSPSSHYRAVGASAPGYSIDAKSLTKRSHAVAFTGDKLDIESVSKEANPSPALVQIACDHVAMKIAMAAQFFQDDEKMLMLLASPRRT
jgi:hypothetical protein